MAGGKIGADFHRSHPGSTMGNGKPSNSWQMLYPQKFGINKCNYLKFKVLGL